LAGVAAADNLNRFYPENCGLGIVTPCVKGSVLQL